MAIYLPIMAGVAVFLLTYAVINILYISWVESDVGYRGSSKLMDSALGPVIARLVQFNRRLPVEASVSTLDRKLVLAGSPGGINGYEYLSMIEFVTLAAFVFLLLFLGAASGLSLVLVIFSAFVAGIILFIGFEWLNGKVSSRRKYISRQFPYFLDLSVMTMDAGSTFLESVDIYTRDNIDNALSEELNMMSSEINMGKTLDDALVNFEHRISAEEVQNCLRAIRQGQKMGTPLTKVLRDEAENLRFKRSQLAERAAEEMKVKLQGPAMLLMISVLLLVLGPALVEMLESGVI